MQGTGTGKHGGGWCPFYLTKFICYAGRLWILVAIISLMLFSFLPSPLAMSEVGDEAVSMLSDIPGDMVVVEEGSLATEVLTVSPTPMVAHIGGVPVETIISQSVELGKAVFMMFYADWCGFCSKQKPIVDELEQAHGERITFVRVDADANPDILQEFGVTAFPTMMLISDQDRNGEYEYKRYDGFTEKATLEMYLADTESSVLGGLDDTDSPGQECVHKPDVTSPASAASFELDSVYDALTDDALEDSDGDGVGNDVDNCPDVANPLQEDTEVIYLPDICLPCEGEFGLVDPCCYRIPGGVVFGDLVGDACDNCPKVVNPDQADNDSDEQGDACDPDDDNDDVPDASDNCQFTPNPGQADFNSNGVGDACDEDDDSDSVLDLVDNCPLTPNPNQADGDSDGVGDACDNCPYVPNPDQVDSDVYGGACIGPGGCPDIFDRTTCRLAGLSGEGCEWCLDCGYLRSPGDGIGDACDNCPATRNPEFPWTDTNGDWHRTGQKDFDLDGRGDVCDNCPYNYNPLQDDNDGDGTGNSCEPNPCDQNTQQGGCVGGPLCDGVTDPERCVETGGVLLPSCRWEPICGCISGFANTNGDWVDGCEDHDSDHDRVGDSIDNCPDVANPDQADTDVFDWNVIGWTKIASSLTGDTFYPANVGDVGYLIDNDPDTYLDWQDGVSSVTLTVKMHAPYILVMITLDNRFGHGNYLVEYSTDTTDGFDGTWWNFSTAYPGWSSYSHIHAGDHAEIGIEYPDTPIQYFRVTLTGTAGETYPTLSEIGLYIQRGDGVGDACDNCPHTRNAGQQDDDIDGGDGVGSECDNCPFHSNSDQADDDEDGVGDICDNCPYDSNPGQEDIDKDQQGDICDCDDGYQGPSELGPDCGPGCDVPCSDVWSYLSCNPLIYRGNPLYTIDLVLIPDGGDYPGDDIGQFRVFLDRCTRFIRNALYGNEDILSNSDKINVWYVPRFDGRVRVEADGGCDFDFPEDWRDDCPWADVGAIIHEDVDHPTIFECTDRARGDEFSSNAYYYGMFLHEFSHAVFDLADEYDDDTCSTSYETGEPFQNIWESDEDCRAESLRPEKCHNFTDCRDGLFKSDPDDCIMAGGGLAVLPYGPDCARQVAAIFRVYAIIRDLLRDLLFSQPAAIPREYENPPSSHAAKSIVLYLNISQGIITEKETHVVYGYAPNHILNLNAYTVQLLSAGGRLLDEFSIRDPTYFHYALGGAEYRDNVDFEVVVPWVEAEMPGEVRILDKPTGEQVATIDLGEAAHSFCDIHSDDPDCKADSRSILWVIVPSVVIIALLVVQDWQRRKHAAS